MLHRLGRRAHAHFCAISCPMPAQQRVRVAIAQGRAPHAVRPRSQPSAILVGATQWPGLQPAPQEPVFFDQVSDRLPLPALQPAGQHAHMICSATGSITGQAHITKAG
jgi:hypothetical protein